MRVVILCLGRELQRDLGGQLSQEGVFLVTNGQPLILSSRGQDLKQTFQLSLVVQRLTKQFWGIKEGNRCGQMLEDGASTRTNGCVIDIIIGSNHSKVERRKIHFILNRQTFGLFQSCQSVFHQLREMVRKMTMGNPCRSCKTISAKYNEDVRFLPCKL